VNTGHICPLLQLMDLKWKYKVRIFIDESISLGVLGQNGRGVTEHFNVNIEDVDMIMATLENSFASTGGFCVGRSFVVDHQRLSGLGYCFSASLPPLLATSVGESLRIMQKEPERFVELQHNAQRIKQGLMEALAKSEFYVEVDDGSPVMHIKHKHDNEDQLDKLVDYAFAKNIALTRARYLVKEEQFQPKPSIRISVNAKLTDQEINTFLSVIRQAAIVGEDK